MTYRNKLLLKRLAIVLGILVLVVAAALIIGFSYLGRYVIYTENGAYFDFNSAEHMEIEEGLTVLPPEDPVLVTGESILETTVLSDDDFIRLAADEVNGLLVDYKTLKDGSTLNAIELIETDYNMLVLEMRSGGSEILNTEPVNRLIKRAKDQNIKLVAMISCLDDRAYGLENMNDALRIEGGPLWVSSGGSYWLDPTSDTVEDYIANMILTLTEMGFQEVILNNYYFPESTYIIYPSEVSRSELLVSAYEKLEERIGLRCTLGILVTNPSQGHQAIDYAEHIYVYYDGGSKLADYKASHPDHYVVFVTESHDTRFDHYGKIMVENEDAAFIPEPTEETQETTDE